MGRASAVLAGILALAPATGSLAQNAPVNAAAWNSVVQCSTIPKDDDRYACYDRVMGQAGYGPKPEEQAREQRKIFGLKPPRIGGGGDDKPRQQAQVAPPPRDTRDRINTTLDSVTVRGDDKIIITTTDGAVWEQIDGMKIWPPPRPGQSILIRRNGLGGYFCELKSWQAYRCERRQ